MINLFVITKCSLEASFIVSTLFLNTLFQEKDPISNKSLFRHGQVIGLQLPEELDQGHFNEWLQTHFRSSAPRSAKRFSAEKSPEVEEIRICFSSCLKSAILIPVEHTNRSVR